MLTSQRKKYLMDLLEKDRQLVAKKLSEELGVSEDTIRRDLREMAREGMLQRVHGGALPLSPALVDFNQRESIAADEKRAIGQAAAGMIVPGQIVFVDGGTTTAQLIRYLPASLVATIVTHSPSIAMALGGHEHIEVILLGGRFYRHSLVAVGAATVNAIMQIRADCYFMGASSLHPEAGLSTGDYEEAAVKHAMSVQAGKTILLASSEKLDAVSPYQIMPARALDTIVVAKNTEADLLAPYTAMQVEVVYA
ncbi:DeoR/GlpR family DNA-binding transcription regulator [Undibacterium sp. JH2W]|uniref:DeoR/GlpR family DNA-binding transcription regulator n=1 Tax=Undibacterium sp. JH2W TaxID=3413037 RepID=UPI003BF25EDE